MISLAQIKRWSERFPFDEGELEISTLAIIFDYYSDENESANPNSLVDWCYSLSFVSPILVSKQIDEQRVISFSHEAPPLHERKTSFAKPVDTGGNVTKANFLRGNS